MSDAEELISEKEIVEKQGISEEEQKEIFGLSYNDNNPGQLYAIISDQTKNNQRILETFRLPEILRAINENNARKTWETILAILQEIANNRQYSLELPYLMQNINAFAKLMMMAFSRQDLPIPEEFILQFVTECDLISNIIFLSDFENSDMVVKLLMEQNPIDISKIFCLYAINNNLDLGIKVDNDAAKSLAGIWFSKFFQMNRIRPKQLQNIINFTKKYTPKVNVLQIWNAAFHISYFDTESEPEIKKLVCEAALEHFKPVVKSVMPETDKKKILIVTAYWKKKHAVYKSMFSLINSLYGKYSLDLLVPHKHHNDENAGEIFDNVHDSGTDTKTLKIEEINDIERKIREIKPHVIIYVDIGMNPQSVILSTRRIAPIQILCYGHPVSTQSPNMDYFIGGKLTEDAEKSQEFFSERLVLIDGIGAHPERRKYVLQGLKHSNPNKILIGCSWGIHKANAHLMDCLLEIRKKAEEISGKEVIYRFTSVGLADLYYLTSRKELRQIFGAGKVEAVPSSDYNQYMSALEPCDLSIDSYPFGGFNQIMDWLTLRKPIVTWQGDRSASRLASAIMRKVGMEELIAHNREEYIEKTVRIITDGDYRQSLVDKIAGLDLDGLLYDSGEDKSFCKAIDYLIENHDKIQVKKKKAIIIE